MPERTDPRMYYVIVLRRNIDIETVPLSSVPALWWKKVWTTSHRAAFEMCREEIATAVATDFSRCSFDVWVGLEPAGVPHNFQIHRNGWLVRSVLSNEWARRL